MVRFDRDKDRAVVEIGDLLVELRGATGTWAHLALAGRFAVSTKEVPATDSAPTVLKLRTEVDELWVDVLDVHPDARGLLTRDVIEALAAAAATRAAQTVDDTIGLIPMPTLAGASVSSPDLGPQDGVLILRGNLGGSL